MKTALITGASGGIGLELAKLFAAGNFDLVLVARNEERLRVARETLHEQYAVTVTIVACDLCTPGAVDRILTELSVRSITVDILVNNAGFGLAGSFHQHPTQEYVDMIRLNILALTELTHRLLPGMISRHSGRVMNVASAAAYQPGPFMAVYYASKAYVLSFSEALSEELKGTGISVTALCPGPTLTGFLERAGMERMNLVRKIFVKDAKQVARSGYRGCLRGKRVVIPGLLIRSIPFMERFLPKPLILSAVRLLHRRQSAG